MSRSEAQTVTLNPRRLMPSSRPLQETTNEFTESVHFEESRSRNASLRARRGPYSPALARHDRGNADRRCGHRSRASRDRQGSA